MPLCTYTQSSRPFLLKFITPNIPRKTLKRINSLKKNGNTDESPWIVWNKPRKKKTPGIRAEEKQKPLTGTKISPGRLKKKNRTRATTTNRFVSISARHTWFRKGDRQRKHYLRRQKVTPKKTNEPVPGARRGRNGRNKNIKSAISYSCLFILGAGVTKKKKKGTYRCRWGSETSPRITEFPRASASPFVDGKTFSVTIKLYGLSLGAIWDNLSNIDCLWRSGEPRKESRQPRIG